MVSEERETVNELVDQSGANVLACAAGHLIAEATHEIECEKGDVGHVGLRQTKNIGDGRARVRKSMNNCGRGRAGISQSVFEHAEAGSHLGFEAISTCHAKQKICSWQVGNS